jgi:hypothetical protein
LKWETRKEPSFQRWVSVRWAVFSVAVVHAGCIEADILVVDRCRCCQVEARERTEGRVDQEEMGSDGSAGKR